MFLKLDEYRIGLVGFLILMTLTVVTGISVYAVMQHQAESMLSKSLEISVKRNVDLLDSQIAQAMDDTRRFAVGSPVIDNLIQLNAVGGNIKSRTDLQRIAELFRGCSEFCVNGFSINSIKSVLQTGWRSGSERLSSHGLALSTSC